MSRVRACESRGGARRLTQRVYESSGSFLVGLAACVEDGHAVLGRRRRLRGGALVLRVAAAGAVVAAGGRGAVGVGRAVAAAQLVHDPRLRHQFCTRQRKKSSGKLGKCKKTGKMQP